MLSGARPTFARLVDQISTTASDAALSVPGMSCHSSLRGFPHVEGAMEAPNVPTNHTFHGGTVLDPQCYSLPECRHAGGTIS